MELRDPYLENHAEQRRQGAPSYGGQLRRGRGQVQDVQLPRARREGVRLQAVQERTCRERVGAHAAQGNRTQRGSVPLQSARVGRPQGESSGLRDIQLYVPQRESARPQGGRGCASRASARVRAAQGYRPQMESARRKDVQVYRPQGSAQGRDVQDRRAAAPRRRKRARRQMLTMVSMMLVFAVLGCMLLVKGYQVLAAEPKPHEIPHRDSSAEGGLVQGIPAAEFAKRPEMEENFLTPNEYSRPGEALPEVKNVFVHYTANPGTSAAQNRNYFEQQKDSHENSVSAHFIIGCEGEIIQCVPLNEIAYAVAGRNYDSVSIECCHKTEDGSFTRETYDSLVGLLAWLTDVYDLDSEDILRHYDSNGKLCPLYYTEHPEAWEQLKEDVETFRRHPSK